MLYATTFCSCDGYEWEITFISVKKDSFVAIFFIFSYICYNDWESQKKEGIQHDVTSRKITSSDAQRTSRWLFSDKSI